jgi:hypothetical protein
MKRIQETNEFGVPITIFSNSDGPVITVCPALADDEIVPEHALLLVAGQAGDLLSLLPDCPRVVSVHNGLNGY